MESRGTNKATIPPNPPTKADEVPSEELYPPWTIKTIGNNNTNTDNDEMNKNGNYPNQAYHHIYDTKVFTTPSVLSYPSSSCLSQYNKNKDSTLIILRPSSCTIFTNDDNTNCYFISSFPSTSKQYNEDLI